jgi:hypothetical protein
MKEDIANLNPAQPPDGKFEEVNDKRTTKFGPNLMLKMAADIQYLDGNDPKLEICSKASI